MHPSTQSGYFVCSLCHHQIRKGNVRTLGNDDRACDPCYVKHHSPSKSTSSQSSVWSVTQSINQPTIQPNNPPIGVRTRLQALRPKCLPAAAVTAQQAAHSNNVFINQSDRSVQSISSQIASQQINQLTNLAAQQSQTIIQQNHQSMPPPSPRRSSRQLLKHAKPIHLTVNGKSVDQLADHQSLLQRLLKCNINIDWSNQCLSFNIRELGTQQHINVRISQSQNLMIDVTQSNPPRKRASFVDLSRDSQRKRIKRLKADLEDLSQYIDCPVDSVLLPTKVPTKDMIHLPTSVRNDIRTVGKLRQFVKSEHSFKKLKNKLSVSHGTKTASFCKEIVLVHPPDEPDEPPVEFQGAYVVNPLKLIEKTCKSARRIALGGDCGGGITKLGITWSERPPGQRHATSHFLCLLVYEGSDKWPFLNALKTPGLTRFKGQSRHHATILDIFQHLINRKGKLKAYLNGDWLFLNALLGIKSPSCTYPCPICLVNSDRLDDKKVYKERLATHRNSMHKTFTPLLTIKAKMIVPAPLHVMLGLANKIIGETVPNHFSEDERKIEYDKLVKNVKSVHQPGHSGRSSVKSFNGPEITKWLKEECMEKLSENDTGLTPERCSVHDDCAEMNEWIASMQHNLLGTTKRISDRALMKWRSKAATIRREWQNKTNTNPIPKLHLLRHSVDFMKNHRFLAELSESRIESFHAQFNRLYHIHHHNLGGLVPERLRRALADSILTALQPMIKDDDVDSDNEEIDTDEEHDENVDVEASDVHVSDSNTEIVRMATEEEQESKYASEE